tara:strand:- start:3051 stop:3176 length:126 start_codon:yes stop_codon:yes gene_type:complete
MIDAQFGAEMLFVGSEEPTASVKIGSLGLETNQIPEITKNM